MALNSKLINRVTNLSAVDAVHTHSYAKAQRNTPVTVNNMSFSERMQLERNRQVIQGYRHSAIGQRRNFNKAELWSRKSGATQAGDSPAETAHLGMDAHIDKARVGRSYGPASTGVNAEARQQMAARFDVKRPTPGNR